MSEEIHILTIIGVSLVIGICIGFVSMVFITQNTIKNLNNELDKFRDLYFDEMDTWKNKYDDDGYNAY